MHVKHESTLLMQDKLNYPFGESAFFTACQPLITNSLKLLGLKNVTVAVINLIMIFSIPVCSFFIYKIISFFGNDSPFSVLAATFISFSSPQLFRMSGHFVLTYQFAIPAYIYFILMHFRTQHFKYSVYLFFLTIFMAFTHLYFMVLFFFIYSAYACMRLYETKFTLSAIRKLFFDGFVQLVLPISIVFLFLKQMEVVNDRTTFPYGTLLYINSVAGILMPVKLWYEGFVRHSIWNPEINPYAGIEAHSYIGLFSICIVVSVLIVFFLKPVYSWRIFKSLNREKVLLVLLLFSSIVLLLLSFGWPLIFFEDHKKYDMNVIRQFRALGRFSWNFYYLINILGVLIIAGVISKMKNIILSRFIMAISIILLANDAFSTAWITSRWTYNRIREIDDDKNAMRANLWLRSIDLSKYQAILPLPYFHIGSENLNVRLRGNMPLPAFVASIKTGLPLLAVTSSRISLSQTFQSIQLVSEPCNTLSLIDKLDKNKEILIVYDRSQLNSVEDEIVKSSKLLYQCTTLQIRSIMPAYFNNRIKSVFELNKKAVDSISLQSNKAGNEIVIKDSTSAFLYLSFDHNKHKTAFKGSSSLQVPNGNYFVICDTVLPEYFNNKHLNLSFYIGEINKDVRSRTYASIELVNNGVTQTLYYDGLPSKINRFDSDWGFFEFQFHNSGLSNRIRIVLWNFELINKDYYIDELIIRSSKDTIIKSISKDEYMLNNKYYYNWN
jgi:hypothetical protein